jgi:hypothetical protein
MSWAFEYVGIQETNENVLSMKSINLEIAVGFTQSTRDPRELKTYIVVDRHLFGE